MDASLATDFDLICELSTQERYDYVIVGSGLGGGILARKLAEGKKRVLLIEKGGLLFSTHCLNTSRPAWQIGSVQGPSQDNDIVYNTVKQKVQTARGSDPYVGGPVYCLGGRSTVWGLFAPEISQNILQKYFPERISKHLCEGGYTKAFELFTNGSQTKDSLYPDAERDEITSNEVEETTKRLKEAIEAFYKKTVKEESDRPVPDIKRAPIAAEFKAPRPYEFPQGAYSTVDSLLDKYYAKDKYLTILMNTEVLRVSTDSKCSLTVRNSSRQQVRQIFAKSGIILCAGTIGTAKIALSSGLGGPKSLVGKGLTDHEIWGVRFVRQMDKRLKHPVKLQCEMTVCGSPALLNVAVNANTFFGRSSTAFTPATQYFNKHGEQLREDPAYDTDSQDTNTVNVTLEFHAELFSNAKVESEVLDSPEPDPVIHIRREAPRQGEKAQIEMQNLATIIRNNILKIQDKDEQNKAEQNEPAPRFSLAGFGVVAHEVGTMRLSEDDKPGVVNDHYQVKNNPKLYVCDLSIFPISPPANPSLTLAAMALHLAKDLVGCEQSKL